MKTSDTELEKMVLGGLMILSDLSGDIGSKCLNIIKPNMITDINHKIIYENIRKITLSGRVIEIIELSESVTKDNSYRQNWTYVGEVYKNTGSAANLLNYCVELKSRAQTRFAVNKLNETLVMLTNNGEKDVNGIMGGLGSFVDEFVNKRSDGNGLKHISEIMPNFLDTVNDRFENPDKFKGMTTGVKQLDNILYPKMVRPGTLFVVGARPKMGKTMLLNKIANHSAIELKLATPIFSMEMLEEEVVERAIADESGLSSDIFYNGTSVQSDWGVIGETTSRLNKSNLYINDKAGLTLAEIKSQCRSIARKHKVGYILVDYLTLMESEKAERNDLGYGLITKGLKSLAKELKCCVVLLTQLNRGLESRSNKRPMPSDSRDTGQIEQDADYWVGLYRESVYNDNVPEDMKGYTELEVRLNRHGGVGKCYLNMDKGSFREIELNQYALMDHHTNFNNGNNAL